MRMTFERQMVKITLMVMLLAGYCFMIYYFHVIFQSGAVFTHFFYIPIILASLWWKRKGLAVAIFLGLCLIFSHHFLRDYAVTSDDYFRALMFVVIGSVTALVSERIGKSQEKAAHLNAVLHAIRGVNQLITREKNRDRLLRGICETLIKTRGYHNAWIAMLDESGDLVTTAEAGLGKDFLAMDECLKCGELSACCQKALKQLDAVVTKAPFTICTDCPLSAMYTARGTMTIRLEYKGKVYGVLSASLPVDFTGEEEEQFLFKDVAGDIALALHVIELEEKHDLKEKALRQSEEKYSLLVANIPDVLYTTNANGITTFISQNVEKVYGYTPEEIYEGGDRVWCGRIHPDDLEKVKGAYEALFEKGIRYDIEYRIKRKDEQWIWILDKAETTYVKDGVEYCDGVFTEITARKQAEEELRRHRENLEVLVKERTAELRAANEHLRQEIAERKRAGEALLQSEKKYTTLVENSPDIIYLLDPEGRFTYVGGAVENLLGFTSDELTGKHFTFIVWPEDAENAQWHFNDRRTGDRATKRFELRLITKKGESSQFEIINVTIELNAFGMYNKPVSEKDKKFLGTYGVARDISERKRVEKQLLKSKAMLQTVFDGMSNPLIMLGQDLSVKMLNNAAMKYYQVSEFKKVIGRHCFEAFRGKTCPCEGCKISLAVQDGKECTFEQRSLIFPDRFEQVVLYPLREKEGGITGAIVTVNDITEKRKTEEQLVRADRLSSLGQLSGGIAHEIRNPLSSISLFMDILSDKERFEHTDQELELLSEVKDNVNRIADIIKRVLDLSKLQAVHKNMTDINRLIEGNIKLWQTNISKSKIKLKLSLDKGLPQILGDAIQLQQVFNNLILNAIEAMNKGGILRITTSKGVSSVVRGREVVVIEVGDTGPGINPEDMENIFNPFFTTKTMGTGLGLAISHKIVERHGGIISIESKPNEGTTFSVELPVGRM